MYPEGKRAAKDSKGSNRRRKRTNNNLYQVYPFEEGNSAPSSSKLPRSGQHDVVATSSESKLLAEPHASSLAAPTHSVDMMETLRQMPGGLVSPVQPSGIVSLQLASVQPGLDFATTSVVPVPVPIPLDGSGVASTSYHPHMNMMPTAPFPSRLQPPYLSRTFNADISSYPYSRQPHPLDSQSFNRGYPSGYPPIGAESPHTTAAARRGWSHQQQQAPQPGSLGATPSYTSPSLHPPHSAIVSEQQRTNSAFAAPSFSGGVGGTNTGHDNSSMLGMTDQSFASSQAGGFEGQQMPYQDHGGQGSIGPGSLQRSSHDYRTESTDTSSMGGSSSAWGSLPNLRLMRGMQGDLLSSNTSGSQMSTPSDRGQRQHSRAHLQKHLRTLQTEMVALKEKVREAENLYRDTSPGDQSISDTSSGRLHDTLYARNKPVDHFDLRDYRGDERTGQSTSTEGMVESSGSAYSSSFSGYPGTPWRQHPYSGGPSQTASSASSMSVVPPRRGTWKTGAGNVLVFNNAVASDNDMSSRETVFSEQGNEDGDEDEDAGTGATASDEAGKRYQCLVPGCLKSFTTSGHARRHSRTHLGHKLFICPHEGCDSTFTRRDNCRQHQRARHHMTLPVPELTEADTLENLILDRQNSRESQQTAANTAM